METSNQPSTYGRWLWRVALIFAVVAASALSVGCQREQMEDEEPVESETVEPTAEAEETAEAAVEEVEFTDVFAEPGEYVEQQVTGQAPVIESVSDRGFWLGHKQDKLFVVIPQDVSPEDQSQQDQMTKVEAGQVVEVSGTVHTSDDAMAAAEGELDAKTRAAVADADNVLVVDNDAVQVVSQPKAGADKKMLKVGGKEYGSFADYDADENNFLTARELTRGLEDREFYGEWDKNDDQMLDEREFAAHFYTVVDVNEDDRIDRDEFEFVKANFDQFSDTTFSKWDKNKNDWLDNDEFFTQVEDAEVFDDWDTNDTDNVEYNEYGKGVVGMWDGNDDGFLELDEFGFEEEVEVTLK